jgi:hypothetical protein
MFVEGHFRGLKARGDVEVDAKWQAKKALSAALRPAVAGEFKLRPPHGQRIAKVETGGHAVATTEVNGDWRVRLEPHKEYTITFE